MNIDAQNLKQQRTSRAWTQQQLADAAGLSLRTIQRIERYGTGASESVLCIAAAMNIDSSELISDDAFEEIKIEADGYTFSLKQMVAAMMAGGLIGVVLMMFIW